MIDPNLWMPEALARLQAAFGPRLLYLGLQGSTRRGEATESSDIDLVVVLDTLALDDLDRYRAVVRALPEGEKTCGFIADQATLAAWPKHELFAFRMDTRDYHGSLEALLPPVGREDIQDAARNGASGLYHLVAHSYLYAKDEEMPAILAGAYKGAFFVMLVVEYLRSGTFYETKAALRQALQGREREIMEASLGFDAWLAGRSVGEATELLLDWSREVLAGLRSR